MDNSVKKKKKKIPLMPDWIFFGTLDNVLHSLQFRECS